MSYNNGEALLLARIRAHANFDSNNSSREDWSILHSGKSENEIYAVLRPGKHTEMPGVGGRYDATWETIIELWQRYTYDGVTVSNYGSRRDEILNQIRTKPNMGDTTDTVHRFKVTGSTEPEEMWKGDRLEWLKGEVVVEWEEHIYVTIS